METNSIIDEYKRYFKLYKKTKGNYEHRFFIPIKDSSDNIVLSFMAPIIHDSILIVIEKYAKCKIYPPTNRGFIDFFREVMPENIASEITEIPFSKNLSLILNHVSEKWDEPKTDEPKNEDLPKRKETEKPISSMPKSNSVFEKNHRKDILFKSIDEMFEILSTIDFNKINENNIKGIEYAMRLIEIQYELLKEKQ